MKPFDPRQCTDAELDEIAGRLLDMSIEHAQFGCWIFALDSLERARICVDEFYRRHPESVYAPLIAVYDATHQHILNQMK